MLEIKLQVKFIYIDYNFGKELNDQDVSDLEDDLGDDFIE